MFYTYWCVSDAKNKNDEVFICHTDIYKCYKFKYIECKRIVEDIGICKSSDELTSENIITEVLVPNGYSSARYCLNRSIIFCREINL